MSHLLIHRRPITLIATLLLTLGFTNINAAANPSNSATNAAANGYSASALFNQGNAFARHGKIGQAILDYERALILAPTDPDIAANLHFVRTKAGLPDAPENSITYWLTSIPPNTQAWLGCFGLVLAGGTVLLGRIFRHHRLSFRFATLVGSLLAVAAIGSAVLLWPKVHTAVVLTSDAPARISPANAAESLFKLREGETVSVRSEHDEFLLVQTPAGRSGWVASADVGRVIPPTPLTS